MTLGENLQKLRTAKGLSQEDVARVLYVSRQSVSKWENDAAEPGVEGLKALAKLYGVTLDQLLLAEEPAAGDDIQSAGEDDPGPPSVAPADRKRADRAYLIWTGVLVALCAAEAAVFMRYYHTVTIPWSVIAMVVGIWVRYPAMWVVTVCLFGVDLLWSVVELTMGGVITGPIGLAADLIWLWAMCRPAMRERFGMRG